MKTVLLSLIFLIGFTVTSAHGQDSDVVYPPAPVPVTKQNMAPLLARLNQQAEGLIQKNAKTCEKDFEDLYSGDTLKFSIAYGYMKAQDAAVDGAYANTLVRFLRQPCKSNLEACGFHLLKSRDGNYELQKEMLVNGQKKKVLIQVYAPAVSWNDTANTDTRNLYFTQRERSAQVEKMFHQSIQASQVVFYNGHSMGKAGPGFGPRHRLLTGVDQWTKPGMKKMATALKKDGRKMKLFGLFACSTEQDHEESVVRAAPDLDLIVSTVDLPMHESEQSMIGAINSVLNRSCEEDFAESMRSVKIPDREMMVVKGLFDQPTQAGARAQKRTSQNGFSRAK